MTGDRAWLAAVCASELGTLLVFSNFAALLPTLQAEWGLSTPKPGSSWRSTRSATSAP